jgi:hypothetical protein
MPVKPLAAGSYFETLTYNGYINVTGSDVTECIVTATLVGYAESLGAAEEIVEKTKLTFEQADDELVLKIDKPRNLHNRSVSVSLDIIVPDNINLELETYNGYINIENITGRVEATTNNGKMTAKNVYGTNILETYNGKIIAEDISGDIKLKTYNGSVKAYYSDSIQPAPDISMVTYNGGISLTTPPDYSAKVYASTYNGSIDTDLPITVIGKVKKNKLTGTIGEGQAELHLETYNGSIRIR